MVGPDLTKHLEFVMRLEAERYIAVRALEQIAQADFRGNRPGEQVVAQLALDEIKKLK